MKRLLRLLPFLATFVAGWAGAYYYVTSAGAPAAAKKSAAAARPRSLGTSVTRAQTASLAKTVSGSDSAPKLTPWTVDSPLGKIISETAGAERTLAIASLIDQTPVDQLATLINQARACPDEQSRRALLDMAYSKWTVADPQAALAFARVAATKRFDRDSGPLNQVLTTWAGHDPQGALAAAQHLDYASFRNEGIREVLNAWAQTADPQGAVAAAKSLDLGSRRNEVIASVFDSWSKRDPQGAFAALGQVDSVTQRAELSYQIINTMVEQDPKGALDLLRSQPLGMQNPDNYSYVFSRLAMQDPAAAVAALNEVPAGSVHTYAINSIACDWADADPHAAIAWASGLTNPADRQTALLMAVRHQSGSDPLGAVENLKLLSADQRTNALPSIIQHWADRDPGTALQWLQNNTTGAAFDQNVSQAIDTINATNPAFAANFLAQMPDGPNRVRMVNQTISAWSQQDPNAALQWANANLSGTELNNASIQIIRNLAAIDPAAAATQAAQMPNGPARNSALNAITASYAKQDLNAAIDWANNISDADPARRSALMSLVNSWSQLDPAGAAAKVSSLNLAGDPTLSSISNNLARQLAATDPAAALAWAQSLPDANAQLSAYNSAISSIASSDPASALNYAQSLPEGSPRDATITNVIASWGRQDPVAALNLVTAMPAGEMRTVAVSNVASAWIRQDPMAASKWINTLPTSPERDSAVNALINSEGQYDPATAISWAATLSTPDAQFNGYRTAISQLARKDPAAAQAAVSTLKVTDEQRQVLQQTATQATPQSGRAAIRLSDNAFSVGSAGAQPTVITTESSSGVTRIITTTTDPSTGAVQQSIISTSAPIPIPSLPNGINTGADSPVRYQINDGQTIMIAPAR